MDTTIKFESTDEFVDFVDHASMAEILSTARAGWPSGATAIHDLLQRLSLYIEPEKFWKEFNPNVTGMFFDIGLVCAGIPECWLDPQDAFNNGSFMSTEPDEEKPVIRLGINITEPLGASRKDALQKGAIAAIFAYLLEQSGRAVSITQYCSMSKNNHNFYGSVVIKTAEQKLDMDLLSFWLVSPNSFRSCWMRIIESLPNAKQLGVSGGFCGTPNTEYGLEFSDAFIAGAKNKREEWSLDNCVEWLCNGLDKLKIAYIQ